MQPHLSTASRTLQQSPDYQEGLEVGLQERESPMVSVGSCQGAAWRGSGLWRYVLRCYTGQRQAVNACPNPLGWASHNAGADAVLPGLTVQPGHLLRGGYPKS